MKKKVRINIVLLLSVSFIALFVFSEKNTIQNKEIQAQNKKTITLLAPYETVEHRQLFIDLARTYSDQNKGIKVQISFAPYEDYNKKLLIDYSQGNLPDMVILENANMPSFIKIGMLRPVTEYVKKEKLLPLYYDVLWQNTMDNGEYYGMPLTCSTYALFCNLDILNKNHIAIPQTWNELKTAAKKSTTDGAQGFGISAKQTEQSTSQFLQLLYSTGASVDNINQENGIDAFRLLEYMVKDGSLDKNSINLSESDLRRQFAGRRIAMMMNSSDQVPGLRAEKPGFHWAAVLLPWYIKKACVVTGENIGITTSGNYQECVKFIAYLNTTENIKEIALRYGGIPTRRDLTDLVSNEPGAVDHIFYNQMEYAVAKGPYTAWINISTAISGGIFNLLTYGQTSDQVVQTLQSEIRDYIVTG